MDNTFKVEVSARHVHLNQEAIDVLFGSGYELTVKKNLSQPGQFACVERVDIVGPKNTIKNVSVLGPKRGKVQVEVSATDARNLGVACCIRGSGDIEGTPGCELVGPKGTLKIENGLIVARRHIHANSSDAKKFGFTDGQEVWVEILTDDRKLIFGDVLVRISDSFNLAMHIDTDESNAAGCGFEATGRIFSR